MTSNRARWWKPVQVDRLICGLCPRACKLDPGERGFCFVRRNLHGELRTESYGAVSSLAIDPIEKKPLYHLLPGSDVLSMGAIGCNLNCAFCQNHQISRASSTHLLRKISAEEIVRGAREQSCESIAFTYNEPVVAGEFVCDVSALAHEAGLYNVMVSNGYVTRHAARDLFRHIDAVNVDLKAFREEFYKRLCDAKLSPVLRLLQYLRAETKVWVELTHLVIPGENDSEEDMHRLAAWVAREMGPGTPLHLSAFYPTHRMKHVPATPEELIHRLVDVARAEGLQFVYPGNVPESRSGDTRCPVCATTLIERSRMGLRHAVLKSGRCPICDTAIPGIW